ncbi:MAG TPA: hypothetical protein VHD63_00570 [Ktedonobacteraceae bacterium]|nr:hypothetical protein [Ktedonobacteraceae bacterium]
MSIIPFALSHSCYFPNLTPVLADGNGGKSAETPLVILLILIIPLF